MEMFSYAMLRQLSTTKSTISGLIELGKSILNTNPLRNSNKIQTRRA